MSISGDVAERRYESHSKGIAAAAVCRDSPKGWVRIARSTQVFTIFDATLFSVSVLTVAEIPTTYRELRSSLGVKECSQ